MWIYFLRNIFIDCFFVLENTATFDRVIVQEIRHMLLKQICLRGQFPRRVNLTHFGFESNLIDI